MEEGEGRGDWEARAHAEAVALPVGSGAEGEGEAEAHAVGRALPEGGTLPERALEALLLRRPLAVDVGAPLEGEGVCECEGVVVPPPPPAPPGEALRRALPLVVGEGGPPMGVAGDDGVALFGAEGVAASAGGESEGVDERVAPPPSAERGRHVPRRGRANSARGRHAWGRREGWRARG